MTCHVIFSILGLTPWNLPYNKLFLSIIFINIVESPYGYLKHKQLNTWPPDRQCDKWQSTGVCSWFQICCYITVISEVVLLHHCCSNNVLYCHRLLLSCIIKSLVLLYVVLVLHCFISVVLLYHCLFYYVLLHDYLSFYFAVTSQFVFRSYCYITVYFCVDFIFFYVV